MTKRRILLFIWCCIVAGMAGAQEKKVALGLTFEPCINWMKSNSSGLESNGNMFGFNYGLLADFSFGENYAYSTGILISNAGYKLKQDFKSDSTSYSIEDNLKIQSVRMPVLLKMMTKEIGYLRYYGLFGFQFDYVYSATSDQRVNGGPEKSDVDVRADVSDVNLSLSLGLGILYNLSGTTNFMAGISFNNGFIDMLEGSSGSGDELKANTRQLTLNLGVLF